RLGGGGQAEVFRGMAESIQGYKKAVAIKRVLPHLTSNPQFVAMFLDEARLSLFLQHANVVQVFDVSKAEDGTYFLVMEFVDGCDLKHLMAHQTEKNIRDLGLGLYIMIEASKGLHYAHTLEHPYTGKALNIVHRDISPPNIMLSKNGEVKVVDFGLAKASSQLENTDEGVVKGKFSYLSPEAASGVDVDARADVFALGTLTWELLAGRRLFVGDDPYATVQLVREARVPSLPALDPNITPELDAIVRQALASAADYGDALAGYLFSNQLKASSRDVASAVRATKIDRDRAGNPRASLIHALVMDELQRMTSLVEDELGSKPIELTSSGDVVNTNDWTKDLIDD
ncbi:MAG: serine/threonine-protein kinase, partial [Kofleriaceae bacterium]